MIEVTLHTGIEHPNLLWIVGASLLSFAGGVGVGLYGRSEEETDGAAVSDNPDA